MGTILFFYSEAIFKKLSLFVYFSFGCPGSLLLRSGFLWLRRAGFTLPLWAWVFLIEEQGSGAQAQWGGPRARARCGMWNLPRAEIKPVSLASACRFLTTGLPGTSLKLFLRLPNREVFLTFFFSLDFSYPLHVSLLGMKVGKNKPTDKPHPCNFLIVAKCSRAVLSGSVIRWKQGFRVAYGLCNILERSLKLWGSKRRLCLIGLPWYVKVPGKLHLLDKYSFLFPLLCSGFT